MGCQPGEEERIVQLAAEIDSYVQQIKGNARVVPDDRLFLMAALMVADQLWEAREELQRSLKQMSEFRSYQVIEGGNYVAPRDMQRQAEMAMARAEILPPRTSQSNG